jgi:hypothetical protein
MSNLRVVYINDTVTITIEGKDFGISVCSGRDNDDNDVLHVYLKKAIVETYLGDVKKNERHVVFVPKEKVIALVDQLCKNCAHWEDLSNGMCSKGRCTHLSNTLNLPRFSELLTPAKCWCSHWEDKGD